MRSSSACSAAFVCFSSSCSWRRCASRSASPWSFRVELDELPLDLLLLREDALLDLQHRLAPVGELRVDLGAQLDRLLPRFDLRLAAQRLGFALGVLDQLAADPPRLADARRAEDLNREQGERDSCGDSDGDSDPDQHGGHLARLGSPHPALGPLARIALEVAQFSVRAHARALQKPAYLAVVLRRLPVEIGRRHSGCQTISEFGKAQFAGKMSGEAWLRS